MEIASAPGGAFRVESYRARPGTREIAWKSAPIGRPSVAAFIHGLLAIKRKSRPAKLTNCRWNSSIDGNRFPGGYQFGLAPAITFPVICAPGSVARMLSLPGARALAMMP